MTRAFPRPFASRRIAFCEFPRWRDVSLRRREDADTLNGFSNRLGEMNVYARAWWTRLVETLEINGQVSRCRSRDVFSGRCLWNFERNAELRARMSNSRMSKQQPIVERSSTRTTLTASCERTFESCSELRCLLLFSPLRFQRLVRETETTTKRKHALVTLPRVSSRARVLAIARFSTAKKKTERKKKRIT